MDLSKLSTGDRIAGGAGIVLHFVDLSAEDKEHLGNIVAALPAVESLGKSRDQGVVPIGVLSNERDTGTK